MRALKQSSTANFNCQLADTSDGETGAVELFTKYERT